MNPNSKSFLLISLLLLALPAAHAMEKMTFLFPADCDFPKECYIQNYVDVVPAEEAKNFKGDHLTFNGHRGTDIGVASYDLIYTKPIAVLAAAAGTVVFTREGIADNDSRHYETVKGRECGNKVVIQHGQHWQSHYCHLRKGSIAVKKGQEVTAGETIGFMGASGKADFPHVHLGLRYQGKVVDPFYHKLWATPIPYYNIGIIDMGLSPTGLPLAEVLDTPPRLKTLPHENPKIIFWARIYGVKEGDKEQISFYRPDGRLFKPSTHKMVNGDYAEWYTVKGYSIKGKLPPQLRGQWEIEYKLHRPEEGWIKLGSYFFNVE